MKTLRLIGMAVVVLFMTFALASCGDDDPVEAAMDYDVLKINNVDYACFGNRCAVTYESTWHSKTKYGQVCLPLGTLEKAQNKQYDYDYLVTFTIKDAPLSKGSSIGSANAMTYTEDLGNGTLNYVSGSAVVQEKVTNSTGGGYIVIKFNSLKYANKKNTYVLDGTVTLAYSED